MEALQDGESEHQHDVSVGQHEGPEGEHVAEPSSVSLLACESHDDGQRDGQEQGWYGSLVSGKEAKRRDASPKEVHPCNQHQEDGQHDAVGGPCEPLPVDGSGGQLEEQADGGDAGAGGESLAKGPCWRGFYHLVEKMRGLMFSESQAQSCQLLWLPPLTTSMDSVPSMKE